MSFYSCKKWQVPTRKSSSKELLMSIIYELQEVNSNLHDLKKHNSQVEWLLLEKDNTIKKLKHDYRVLTLEKNKKKGCKRK